MSGESTENKEKALQDAKTKYKEESRFDPTRARYGLFSFTGTLAIGDDSVGRRTKPKRDADGHVITAPRNFYTTPPKAGKNPSALFSSIEYVGSPYTDPSKVLNARKPNPRIDDAQPFKPPGTVDTSFFAYPYEAVVAAAKKVNRDDTGAVIVGPKNILVTPSKGATFSHFPATTGDPYERKWQLAREERVKQTNLIRHERPFRSISPGGREFSTIPETFGKADMKPIIPRLARSAVYYAHDSPFKPPNPSKTSVMDMTLGKYPEHLPCPDAKSPKKESIDTPWK